MGTLNRTQKLGIFAAVAGAVTRPFTMLYRKNVQSAFQRSGNYKCRSRGWKERHFKYEGLDGKTYRVRVGNIFAVRPKRMPFAVIATSDNRLELSI